MHRYDSTQTDIFIPTYFRKICSVTTFQQPETADNTYDLACALYCPCKPLVVIFCCYF